MVAQLIGLVRRGGRTDGRRGAECMNNTRGLSVDFLLLPQLIKDATHCVRQREESRRATRKVGKWANGGVGSRKRGSKRQATREKEAD